MPSKSLLLAVALALPAMAGPVEFGMAEVQRAMAARGLKTGAIRFSAEVNTEAPESFRILPGLIEGGDLRGLMYGLLEAAGQIRETGRLAMAKGTPATPIRGVRYFLNSQDAPIDWAEFCAMLARNRFNRLTLVLGDRPETVPRGLVTLRAVSQAAADHGIDLILGINPESASAWTYEVLRKTLAVCPAIRAIQMRADSRSTREAAFRAIGQAGRRVVLELLPGPLPSGIVEAAKAAHVPLRVSLRYWPGSLGRPYQPAETVPGMSYMNLLEAPRSYECFWSLGSQQLLLWGDPGFARRAAATLTLAGSAGFEIDAPPISKDRPFERNWFFYLLWGQLSYDPKTSEKVWMAELKRRFGAVAPDVLAAYQAGSDVLSEISAASLPDPNMAAWPEVSTGGLLDAYRDAVPADQRFIAGVPEAVLNLLRGVASAKQTPADTAGILRELAAKIDAVLARIGPRIPDNNREWQAAERDFQALALLARYHAHKLLAADQVTWFDETSDPAALKIARREVDAAAADWEKLAQIVLPPTDAGQWKDKLPYVRHDVKLVEEREKVYAQFGVFDFGFDFGGAVAQPRQIAWRSDVAPRFQAVDPRTKYSPLLGYGWLADGDRQAHAILLTPALEVRAIARNPGALPSNVLFGDWISGTGAQVFRIRADDAVYTVFLLHPNGTADSTKLRARNGFLDVAFPDGEWTASGLVVKGPREPEPPPAQKIPKRLPRPNIAHSPPKTAPPDHPLALAVRIFPATGVKAVRLHYRPVNQLAKFKTIETSGAKGLFTIPAADVSRRWDLMYYFEILNQENTGWFDPDPRTATPYYVVRIEP